MWFFFIWTNIELPWDQASTEFFEFREWLDGEYMCLTPWSKLDYLSVAYIRKILVFTPSARYKIKDIESHPWFVKNLGKNCYKLVDENSVLQKWSAALLKHDWKRKGYNENYFTDRYWVALSWFERLWVTQYPTVWCYKSTLLRFW